MVSLPLNMVKIFIPMFLMSQDLVGGVIVGPVLNSVDCLLTDLLNPLFNRKVKFYAWRLTSTHEEIHEVLDVNNITQMEIISKNTFPFFQIYFHDIGDSGLDSWIQKSKTVFFKHEFALTYVAISVEYGNFATTLLNALHFMETISNQTSALIELIHRVSPRSTYCMYGHGMGALMAARTAEIMAKSSSSFIPFNLIALDPEIITPQIMSLLQNCKDVKIPRFENIAGFVHVLHTTTCHYLPLIPACESNSTETLGDMDIFTNGGFLHRGCTDKSWERKRAAKYFVEIFASYFAGNSTYFTWSCSDFKLFRDGACSNCVSYPSGICKPFHFDFVSGRRYLYTNGVPPYGKGLDGNKPDIYTPSFCI